MVSYHSLKPGDILISSPFSNHGLIFHKSIILILSHDKSGSSGIMINKILNLLEGKDILESLKVHKSKSNLKNSKIIPSKDSSLQIFFGGPLEQDKGIIIHSSEYANNPSIELFKGVSISTSADIIKDIVSSCGPQHKMLALGYCGWGVNQLNNELKQNDWLILPNLIEKSQNDSIFKLLFVEDPSFRWQKALKICGIDASKFLNSIGNA